ncbi:hypothetical protein Taro_000731, partial [Colocasia esculenta]|nr:hypothetical protein [Colocasia esculenta]
VVSTQCFKYKAKRPGSVDTSSSSVDTRDSSQNNILANLGQCVDTSSSSVDTRGLPKTPSGLFWDSVSTLAQVVSTLVPFQNKTYRSCGTRKHISCSGSVDTRDSSQNNLLANLGQCVDTSSSSVDTRGLLRTPSGLFWDSVSTLDQVVLTLVPFQNKTYRSCGTRKHISCSGLLTLFITL